jgi:hypothetical protein
VSAPERAPWNERERSAFTKRAFPSIFEKASGESDEYDQAIESMLHMQDRPAGELYDCLAIENIKHAADVLGAVFDTPAPRRASTAATWEALQIR